MRICVFCGSKEGSSPEYRRAARQLGAAIAAKSHSLVYGGAKVGLMGELADACLQAGGEVIGVMPEVLASYEVAHQGLSELHWVKDMHQRKALMENLADRFITLPGGVGTLEEFFEQFTWQQIGVHTKPIALANVAGYYEPMIAFMQSVERAGFLREGDIQRLSLFASIEELVEKFL